jgi:hypothetical protein
MNARTLMTAVILVCLGLDFYLLARIALAGAGAAG